MTAQAQATDLVVRYEGTGSGAHEIWGGTQANFLVAGGTLPAAREVAVMLNDPAAAMLADAAGVENTAEFRADAAMRIGEAAIRAQHARMGRVDSQITVSRMTLEAQPELIDAVR